MNAAQRALNNQGWLLVKDGHYIEGARLLEECIAVRSDYCAQTAAYYRNLAVAHLCLGNYTKALQIERKLIPSLEVSYSIDFAIYGCSIWLCGDFKAAIATWELGRDTDYADSANMQIPLLLWFGNAWIRQDTSEILNLMRRRAGDRRTGMGWPLPIARYVLGSRSLEQLQAEAEMNSHAEVRIRQWRQAQFYLEVEKYQQGDTKSFAASMCEIGGTKEMLFECERFLAQSLAAGHSGRNHD